MKDEIEFRLLRAPFGFDAVELHARQGNAILSPVTFAEVEPGLQTPPAIGLSGNSAQQLMDELWRCGIRPTEGSGSAGSLAATERHLEDFRKIAFKQLKIN